MKPILRSPCTSPRLVAPLLASLVVLALAACGKDGAKPATQVAAKVNKEEISVHQINYVLQRQPGLKSDQTEAAGRQVLERLIDQEVALQKAQEQKLDRDPRVLQELEAARREIIARAYLGKVGEAVQPPSAEEIKGYYDSKPALFRERRIYTLQEVQVEADKGQIADLQAQLPKFKTLQELAEYLKDRKLASRVSQNTTPAENVPLPLLDRFAALKDGQTVFSATPTGARLVTLLQSRSAPIGEEQARPVIEQFIVNDRKRKAVEQALKTSRSNAHIEYIGQFAAQTPAPAASEAAAVPVARDAAIPTAAAPTAVAASGLDAATLNKGLAGLK